MATIEHVFTEVGEHVVYADYGSCYDHLFPSENWLDIEVRGSGGLFRPGGPGGGSSGDLAAMGLGSFGSLVGLAR